MKPLYALTLVVLVSVAASAHATATASTSTSLVPAAGDVLAQVAEDPKTFLMVRVTSYLEQYLTMAGNVGDKALKDLGDKVKDWARATQSKYEKYDFMYILTANIARIYPRYHTKAQVVIKSVFARVREVLDVPNTPYYANLEDIDIQYFRLEPAYIRQSTTFTGLEGKVKMWLQGSFYISVQRWSADATKIKNLLRFKVSITEPIMVESSIKISVGRTPAETKITLTDNVSIDMIGKVALTGDVNVFEERIAGLLTQLEEARGLMKELSKSMLRWRKGTVVKDIATRLAKMMGDADYFIDELDEIVKTGPRLSKDIFVNIIKDGPSVKKLGDKIRKIALDRVETELLRQFNKAGALWVDLLNRRPQPGDAPLEVAVPKFVANTPFLTSDLGQRLQDLILDAFVIKDVTAYERLRYRQRVEEEAHGGAMKTLWECARRRCRRDAESNQKDVASTCNPDRLLDYRATRELDYRTPSSVTTGDRRTCWSVGVLNTYIVANQNRKIQCCRVISDAEGKIKTVHYSEDRCTVHSCLEESSPKAIRDVQVTLGKSNAKEIQRAKEPYQFVAFKGGNKPADIGDDRWFGDKTLVWYLFAHSNRYLNDVQIAWHDNGKERCPQGYETLRKSWNNQETANLNQGWGSRKRGFKHVYLCLSYGPLSPQSIVSMELIYGRSRTSSPGYHIIRRSVTGQFSANFNYGRIRDEKHAVHLAIKRLTSLSDLPSLIEKKKVRELEHERHWNDIVNKKRVPNGLPKLGTQGGVELATASDYLARDDDGVNQVAIATGLGNQIADAHADLQMMAGAPMGSHIASTHTDLPMANSPPESETAGGTELETETALGAQDAATIGQGMFDEDSDLLLADRTLTLVRDRVGDRVNSRTWWGKKKKKQATPTPTPIRAVERYGDNGEGGTVTDRGLVRPQARPADLVLSGWGVYINVLRGADLEGGLGGKLLVYDFGAEKTRLEHAHIKYHDDIRAASGSNSVPAGPGVLAEVKVGAKMRTHILLEGAGGFTGGLARIINFFRGRQDDIELLADRFAGITKNKIMWRTKPDGPAIANVALSVKLAVHYTDNKWQLTVIRMGFDTLHLQVGDTEWKLLTKAAKWVNDKFNLLPKLIEAAFIGVNKNLGVMQGSGKELHDLPGTGAEFEASLTLSLPRRFFESKMTKALYELGKGIVDGAKGTSFGTTE